MVEHANIKYSIYCAIILYIFSNTPWLVGLRLAMFCYICIFSSTGTNSELAKICKKEPLFKQLLIYTNVLMWILFIANCILVFRCCFKQNIILVIYQTLMIINVLAAVISVSYFFVLCLVFDQKCLDHRPNRVDSDVASITVIFIFMCIYVALCGVCMWLVYNYDNKFSCSYSDFYL